MTPQLGDAAAFTRRRVLLFGASGVGLVAAVAFPNIGRLDSDPRYTGYTRAPDLGIAPAKSAKENRVNLVAALSGSARCVVFPPGDYAIDNSRPQVTVTNYRGMFVMQPGARLVFTDNTRCGIRFKGGSGARFYGLNTIYATAPVRRHPAEECVTFDETTGTYVENTRIDGAAAAGLLFWRCTRPTVVDALITNTMADGLHFANCQDGRADRITTVDTGDDGVSFLNYEDGPAYTGGLATNLSVTRSRSRGVAVVGQSGVTIRDVTVRDTTGHGLYCASEKSWKTRVPTNVRFESARVFGGGAYAIGSGEPHSGVHVDKTGRVAVSGVTVERPGAHGLFATGGTMTFVDVTVRNTPASGFNLQRGAYTVDRLTAEDTGSMGLFASHCDRLDYGTITVRNAARTDTLRRAVNVEHNRLVAGQRLWVHDSRSPATGYIIGAYGTQRGSLGAISVDVRGRGLVLENHSRLSYTRS